MRIHILGICGTFMGGIARLALARGHEVTGADANVYPPMSTQLEALGIPLVEGYEVCDELQQAEVVVIGNALSRGNPSVEFVLDEGLRYTSGPAWLAEHVLNGRHVIAVAGTHGKTTTASMVAWLLEAAGLAPGFLIGGVPGNFGVSARLGEGTPFVIEADEYDTAFFDKRSKFVHYRPRIAILNNLEFDHADIFPDLAAIETQFHHLVRTIPASGMVVARHDDPALARVLARGCWTPCETFGPEPGATWHSESLSADCSRFTLFRAGTPAGEVTSSAFGEHNANNAVAAIAAAVHAGAPVAACAQAMAYFAAPKRRLETLYADESYTLYDDFAHHPTAIEVTLAALRARIGNARIVAILEPRSNTMRQGVHADQIAAALADADISLLLEPDDLAWDLVAATASMGSRRQVFSSPEQIVAALPQVLRPGDHIVIMSNGGFGGIHARITALLGQGMPP
ncbi:MAG: UDP-N-acetylmuramate:L-alanyl-gamma-D-glutamyl-meso-diaminopimelate ligase [Gammaproteobacteria bacterium]|nr:UDP-N-acetylmuramate:L-alanyl-gamma-D-glutamyl-meso-diaminopimelate ligase [Gammaproteobacteria bacterium]